MRKGLLIRYRELREKGIAAGSKVPRVLVFAILLAILVGDVSVVAYVVAGELWIVLLGTIVLICALLFSLVLASFPFEKAVSRAGEALAFVSSINILGIALPSFGDQFVNFAAFSVVCLSTLVLWQDRLAEVKPKGTRRGYLAIALTVLPLALAMNEFAIHGGVIPAPFLGEIPVWFFFVACLFGFSEEAIFRGGVQRNLMGLLGWKFSLLAGGLLDAGLMAFWGSGYLILLTFGIAIVMGFIFEKTRSVPICGSIRAMQAFWLILMFYLF
ncbi:MAG: CPBP family intramembrane metalloprotease [Methanomassiliicoccales archaeon]|nr:CPBP family intramembrane metalloprotease [Methanomassiliicoccales archaeon]